MQDYQQIQFSNSDYFNLFEFPAYGFMIVYMKNKEASYQGKLVFFNVQGKFVIFYINFAIFFTYYRNLSIIINNFCSPIKKYGNLFF